jgi:hypothetical protein
MTYRTLTGRDIADALKAVDEDRHMAEQGYIDDDDISDVTVDGRFDFDDFAKRLNSLLAAKL